MFKTPHLSEELHLTALTSFFARWNLILIIISEWWCLSHLIKLYKQS